MAKKRSARLSQRILKQDRQIAQAVLSFEDYQPSNKEFTAKRIRESLEAVEKSSLAEEEAIAALTKARQASIDLEARFHDVVLGAKRQVIAQYGEDSDQIVALGLKKKSERRYGRPKKKLKE